MEKNKNGLKVVIVLLVLIIILLIGFIAFFIEEFIDERDEIRGLYNHNERHIDNNTSNNYHHHSSNATNNNSNITNNGQTSNNYITKENALNIALTNEQINQNDIYDAEVELDYKYNQTVYEVTFNYQQYEYEYYINAESGDILKSFREID